MCLNSDTVDHLPRTITGLRARKQTRLGRSVFEFVLKFKAIIVVSINHDDES